MEHYHYLKKNAKFIDREVTKWSEMIKDWEEGVEIFGAALIGSPLSKPSISHSGASFAPKRFVRCWMHIAHTQLQKNMI